MKLFAVRHGQSAFNLRHLCNDDPDRPGGDLTPLGRSQAEAAAQQLHTQSIQAVLCSPLPRTRQTAAIIGARLGLPAQVEPRLKDIHSGFDGQPVAAYLAAIAADPLRTRPVPGAETLIEHQARVDGFLDWLAGQSYQGVALVAHEETLRVCKARGERLALAAVVGTPFANGAVYAFELAEALARVALPRR